MCVKNSLNFILFYYIFWVLQTSSHFLKRKLCRSLVRYSAQEFLTEESCQCLWHDYSVRNKVLEPCKQCWNFFLVSLANHLNLILSKELQVWVSTSRVTIWEWFIEFFFFLLCCNRGFSCWSLDSFGYRMIYPRQSGATQCLTLAFICTPFRWVKIDYRRGCSFRHCKHFNQRPRVWCFY